jgi:Zn finger protein HypA/HybF involved in hydrogenase expression
MPGLPVWCPKCKKPYRPKDGADRCPNCVKVGAKKKGKDDEIVDLVEAEPAARSRSGSRGGAETEVEEVECPECAEMVKATAKICRHCKADLTGKGGRGGRGGSRGGRAEVARRRMGGGAECACGGYRVESIPIWAIVCAIVFFPLGLLFLLIKEKKCNLCGS